MSTIARKIVGGALAGLLLAGCTGAGPRRRAGRRVRLSIAPAPRTIRCRLRGILVDR